APKRPAKARPRRTCRCLTPSWREGTRLLGVAAGALSTPAPGRSGLTAVRDLAREGVSAPDPVVSR
ncbi:MAG: hypothetical protein ACRDNR_11755, partial [Gaiellaceae bacterium]